MTDRQQIQKIVADYFSRKTSAEIVAEVESMLAQCPVCTDGDGPLCELHAADERTEVERQDVQNR